METFDNNVIARTLILICSISDKFWMNKEILTRAGFEPATSGLRTQSVSLVVHYMMFNFNYSWGKGNYSQMSCS